MSRISQDFIASVGYLYEEINIQQQDFLNEESEHYDAEAAELVEDILSTISVSMVYEGYSAEGIIGFLADSSEQDIVEKYLSFDENILTESAVSEEYIEEQFQQLNEFIGAALRIAGAGLKAAKFAKGAKGLAPLARLGAGLKGAGTATSRVAQQGIKANAVVRPALAKGVQKVKDIAKGAKAALPGIAKGALLAGTGVLTGYAGAKLAGAGEKAPEAAKPSPSDKYNASAALGGQAAFKAGGGAAKMKKNPNMTAADVQKQGMINIRNKKPSNTSAKPAPSPAPAKPAPAKPATFTFNNKQVTDAEVNKRYDELRKTDPQKAADFGKNVHSQKYGQLTQGPSSAEINKSSVEDSIKAQQEIDRKRAEDKKRAEDALQKGANSMKESYEPYEVLLEYLMSGGHADTIEEAHYIMLEMDASAVRTVMEEYENYLLAEEVSKWVNGLVDEGYDLSEYTWDDIVEYYVKEVNLSIVQSMI